MQRVLADITHPARRMTELALPAMLAPSLPACATSVARRSASIAAAAIACLCAETPGFTSPLSINSLLTAISFIGCVAVGMTFITLTGNIMSLALGATVSASALVFLASLSLGHPAGFLATVLFGIVITGGARLSGRVFPRQSDPGQHRRVVAADRRRRLVDRRASHLSRAAPACNSSKAASSASLWRRCCFFITVAIGQFILSWMRIGRLDGHGRQQCSRRDRCRIVEHRNRRYRRLRLGRRMRGNLGNSARSALWLGRYGARRRL